MKSRSPGWSAGWCAKLTKQQQGHELVQSLTQWRHPVPSAYSTLIVASSPGVGVGAYCALIVGAAAGPVPICMPCAMTIGIGAASGAGA